MVLKKEGKLKRYRNRIKQYRQKRTFQNNEKDQPVNVGVGTHEHTPATEWKGSKSISEQNMGTKKI